MKSILRACLAVLVFALMLRFVPASAADAPIVVSRGVMSQTAVDWSHFVAQAQGFYAREGLDVQQTIVDPTTTVSALIGGSLNIVVVDTTGFVLGADKGANIIAVGPVADRNPYYLMASSGIKTIAQLKGKKIGAPSPVEVYTTVLRNLLTKAGLNPDKDVEWVYGGGKTSGSRRSSAAGLMPAYSRHRPTKSCASGECSRSPLLRTSYLASL